MPDKPRQFYFDGKINLQTLIAAITILIAIVIGYVDTNNNIKLIKEEQNDYEEFQEKIEAEYVTQEYLEIVVIERIDRLDATLEQRLLQLELKLQEQLTRIENKINETR